MGVDTVIQHRNNPINDNTSSDFVSADHVLISSGKVDNESDFSKYYAIGLTQRIDYRDSRPVITQGEIGSNSTLVLMGEAQKSLSLNKTIIKGNSLLYALYYAKYRLETNTDYLPLSGVINQGQDMPSSNDYGADDVIGGADIILAVRRLAGGGDNIDNLDAIGLTQGFQLSSNMPVTQLSEMGTHARFILSGKADKAMTFSRVMLRGKSALAALYGLSGSMKIIQDLQRDTFRTPKDIFLIFINKANTEPETIITLEKSVIGSIGSQNTAGAQSTMENLSLSWNKTRYGDSEGIPKNTVGADAYGIGGSNIWLDLDHRIFRQPFNLLLTYCDADDNVLAHQILSRAMMASIGRTFAAGSYTTTEGGSLSWEKTITLDVNGVEI